MDSLEEVLNARGKVCEDTLVAHGPYLYPILGQISRATLLRYGASLYEKQSLANEPRVAAMIEPFGVTTGVLGIAMSALHVARKLKELIDGIQGAPEAVKALSKDLHALQGVLEALNSLLEDSRSTEKRLCAEAMPTLEPHLQNCTTTLDSIFMAIARHTKPSGDPKKSKWSGFIWSFREKEILTLQNRLTTYKMSLDLAISVANLTKSSASFSEIRKSIRGMRKRIEEDSESVADSSFMGSSIAGSDCGFAMKQWLRETESIMDDCPPISKPSSILSEVENPLSRRLSSGALSDPTSSYSSPSDGNASLKSLTTREDSPTASSDIGNALECQRLSEQRALVDFSNTSEDGATPKDDHDFLQRRVQDANHTAASNGATGKPLLPPRHRLYQVQSAPVNGCPWIEIKQANYEGNDYGDNTSIYPNSIPAPVPTSPVSLESLAKRDAVLMPNFVKDCIWMLDMHGLHLPETFGDDGVTEEVNQLRLLLAGDIPLELGLVMDFSCVYPTQEQLIKIRALLRCFFKSLAQPLFTEAFYDTINAAAAPEPVYSQYHILRDFIPRLPDAHYETARHLIPHLHRVCQARPAQHMANKKLASIWANILLPHDLYTASEGREHRELLLQTIISSASTLFRGEPHAGERHFL